MTSSAGATGKGAYIKFGSLVLSANYRSAGNDESIGKVDQSAGSDTYRTYLTTLKDGTASATVKLPAGDTEIYPGLEPGTEDTLEMGPEGTASNKPKTTVLAFVESRSRPLEYEGLITCNVTFQYNGERTDSNY
jgi:hypothetical protein